MTLSTRTCLLLRSLRNMTKPFPNRRAFDCSTGALTLSLHYLSYPSERLHLSLAFHASIPCDSNTKQIIQAAEMTFITIKHGLSRYTKR